MRKVQKKEYVVYQSRSEGEAPAVQKRKETAAVKYKLISVGMILIMLLGTAAVNSADKDSGGGRYHQHLDAVVPSESCTCDGSELCTHLPVIRIDTGGQYIPGEIIRDEEGNTVGFTTSESGEEDILVRIETVEKEGVWHHASDEADQSTLSRFRIRGNSSRNFPKKSYRIDLVTDEAEGGVSQNREVSLLGMNPDNDWSLHGPFLDKTLMRNYMWMNLSAEIMGYAPNVRFCELILDGEYAGVYVLMETVKEDDYRVDLNNADAGAGAYSYLLEMDGVAEGDTLSSGGTEAIAESYTWYTHQMEFDESYTTAFCIRYPREEELTDEVIDYIQRDVSRVERGLYSSDMITGRYDYEREIDVDSFVDYYILQEFLAVNDAFSRSTYLYRDIRGKLTIGPVWDYNNVLNNFFHEFSRSGFLLENRSWYGRLMTDEGFVQRVIDRYRQLRQSILSDEYLDSYIDDVIEYLGPAVERNDEVWGWSYDPELLELRQRREPDGDETLAEANPSSYEDAVSRMKGYMFSRAEWLDEHIEDLYQHCHRSRNASQWVQ